MEREILFRGWNSNTDEWAYSMSIIIESHKHPHVDLYFIGNSPVEEDTIGEYTGLKDKEGNRIFEGDIVEFTYWWFDGQENDTQLIGHIGYNHDVLSYELIGIKNKDWLRHIGGDGKTPDSVPFAFFRFTEDDFKVIGNIHDNPELLK